MNKIVEKIHRKFDTASEKLLTEAKAIVAAPVVLETEKIERLNKIGFNAAKPIGDAEKGFKKKEAAKEMIEAIEYYQVYYPSYKFIHEEQIQKICKKYKLLYGDGSNYLGDIPEKNLAEIEAFKLREEDYHEEELWGGGWLNSMILRYSNPIPSPFFYYSPDSVLRSDTEKQETFKGIIPTIMEQQAKEEISVTETPKKQKPPFKICAPQKDFNMQGYEVKEGYKIVYDPIVIQPVKYKSILGGLIVSKWGLEGKDESLVNEIQN